MIEGDCVRGKKGEESNEIEKKQTKEMGKSRDIKRLECFNEKINELHLGRKREREGMRKKIKEKKRKEEKKDQRKRNYPAFQVKRMRDNNF